MGGSHLPRWRLICCSYTSASGCSFLRFVRAVSSAEKALPRPELCNWSHSSSSFNVQHKCHLLCEVPAVPPGCLYVRPTQVYLCLHHRIYHSLTYSSRRCPRSLSLPLARAASSAKAGAVSAFYTPNAESSDRNAG